MGRRAGREVYKSSTFISQQISQLLMREEGKKGGDEGTNNQLLNFTPKQTTLKLHIVYSHTLFPNDKTSFSLQIHLPWTPPHYRQCNVEQLLHPLTLEHLSDMVYIFKYIIFSLSSQYSSSSMMLKLFLFFPLWVNKKNWGERKERKTGIEMVLISNEWF